MQSCKPRSPPPLTEGRQASCPDACFHLPAWQLPSTPLHTHTPKSPSPPFLLLPHPTRRKQAEWKEASWELGRSCRPGPPPAAPPTHTHRTSKHATQNGVPSPPQARATTPTPPPTSRARALSRLHLAAGQSRGAPQGSRSGRRRSGTPPARPRSPSLSLYPGKSSSRRNGRDALPLWGGDWRRGKVTGIESGARGPARRREGRESGGGSVPLFPRSCSGGVGSPNPADSTRPACAPVILVSRSIGDWASWCATAEAGLTPGSHSIANHFYFLYRE